LRLALTKRSVGPRAFWLAALLALWPLCGSARGVYLTAEAFLVEAFAGAEPRLETLWLSPEIKQRATRILDHPPAGLRLRFWRAGSRTAWILDEIGKTHPITIGVVVEDGAVAAIRVLEFRESRGDEVRFPFFTQQFEGVGLKAGEALRLDRTIDGITGATLSVSAMERVARLALLFHAEATGGSAGA
jgi:hypothetical protein